jgi:hypothetical protein
MSDELNKLLSSLAERFCERRALQSLFRFLPALFAVNGLTDGWELSRKALSDTRALCRSDLTADEREDIDRAINLIDRMLG